MDTKTQASGALAIASGSALLGTIGVFAHYANANPLATTWFRCAFGLLGLTLWLWRGRRLRALRLTRETGPWAVLAGTLMVAAWVLFFGAIERTSAGMAIVLFHFQPMWVLILGRLCLKEPVGRRRIGAVAMAMAGLLLATGLVEHASSTEVQREGYWAGVGFCLVGSVCTASVTIIARKLRNLPPGILAWWQCAIGTAALWLWPQGWPEFGAAWLWLSGLGLIHTALAYTLLYAGMASLPSGRIAVLQFIYPAVAIAIDRLAFDQRLSNYQLAGIVIMGACIWLAERNPKMRPAFGSLPNARRNKDMPPWISTPPPTDAPAATGREELPNSSPTTTANGAFRWPTTSACSRRSASKASSRD